MVNQPNLSRGRPKKKPEAVKTGYLGFRVPEEEIKAIESAAGAAGESVSEYVRKAVASRMESHKQVEPSASVSYAIPSMKISDRKSSTSQTRSPSLSLEAIQTKVPLHVVFNSESSLKVESGLTIEVEAPEERDAPETKKDEE